MNRGSSTRGALKTRSCSRLDSGIVLEWSIKKEELLRIGLVDPPCVEPQKGGVFRKWTRGLSTRGVTSPAVTDGDPATLQAQSQKNQGCTGMILAMDPRRSSDLCFHLSQRLPPTRHHYFFFSFFGIIAPISYIKRFSEIWSSVIYFSFIWLGLTCRSV